MIRQLFQELHRRRVFRTAGLYTVGAWLAVQVSAVFFPAWGLSTTALNNVLLTIILGFPIALVFGWFFDITKQGIVRTEALSSDDVEQGGGLQRKDFWLLGILALGASAIVLFGLRSIIDHQQAALPEESPPVTTSAKPAHSIAVLPFVNTSTDPDNELFCDGISEEILLKLAAFKGLHVIGRTSSFTFKNSDYRIPRIAGLLGVRFLLQGSVRRDGDQLRITASLVDDTGAQHWVSVFDRKLDSVFAIQSEIAEIVAKTVAPKIVLADTQEYQPDLVAYQNYLAGRELIRRREQGGRALLKKAVQQDPQFALAHVEYAISEFLHYDGRRNFDIGKKSIEKALALEPGLPRARAAQALYLTSTTDPGSKVAEEILLGVLADDPGMVDAMNWLAGVYSAQGRTEEALALSEIALRKDPLHGVIAGNIAHHYFSHGKYEQAQSLLLRLLDTPDPPLMAMATLGDFYRYRCDLVKAYQLELRALETKKKSPYYRLTRIYAILGMWRNARDWSTLSIRDEPHRGLNRTGVPQAQTAFWTGDFASARDHLLAGQRDYPDEWRYHQYQALLLGETWAQLGEYEQAARILEERSKDKRIQHMDIYFARIMPTLAWLYQQTGDGESSRALFSELEEHYTETDRSGELHTSDQLFVFAKSAAFQGNFETAIERLERAVDAGWCEANLIASDVLWRPLKKYPRFNHLIDQVKTTVDRQRVEIEQLENANVLPAPLREGS